MKVKFYLCENSGYLLYEGMKNQDSAWEAVKLPCAGRVEKDHLLEVLNSKNVEKVVIVGCFEGTCRYLFGNVRCRKRLDALKKDLHALQIDSNLIEFHSFTSNMRDEFELLLEKYRG